MKNAFVPSLDPKKNSDVLILPIWEGGHEAASIEHAKSSLQSILSFGDFKGKQGETDFIYPSGERILLVGLGKKEKATSESLRRSYSAAVKQVLAKRLKSAHILLPFQSHLSREDILRGVVEGVFLSNYAYTRLKGESDHESSSSLLESVHWVGLGSADQSFVEKTETICSNVRFARELINGNADEITPAYLAHTAKALSQVSSKIEVSVFDRKWLEQQKMGLILAVNRGSDLDPFMIQASYKGNPGSQDHIVLVGKGITYDTGGLSLKPTDNMLLMKCDMAGGATVLAAVRAAALLGLKVNVTALVPTTENSIGPKSYKLGDVYRSYSGKTVEVNNTDAEGRLILADALAYAAAHLHPTCMIDLATLTGNIVMALGEEFSGLFSNSDALADDLMKASHKTSELLWRMPLYGEYRDSLKSDIADMTNIGGKEAGAIKAALFLQEFIGSGTSWAHLDIAGPAYSSKPKHYSPTRSTGYGVRLLIDFLEARQGR